jgi:hypothetical protein
MPGHDLRALGITADVGWLRRPRERLVTIGSRIRV